MIQIPLLTIISGLLTIGVRLTGLMLFAPVLRQRRDSFAGQGDSGAVDYGAAVSHGWA